MNKLVKRPFTLMEVMIAFVLILFCLVPLIYPNLAIYKEQLKSNQKIELDHAVTLLFGNLQELMHKRMIPYELITQKDFEPIPISSETYAEAGINPAEFPFTGTLKARRVKQKGHKKNGSYIVDLIEFRYSFGRNDGRDNPIEFVYQIPIVKLKPLSEQPQPEAPATGQEP